MRTIDLGYTGESFSGKIIEWKSLGLSSDWLEFIEKTAPGSRPHDIQIKAIEDCGLLHSRRNLVVSGPTNSGKSLLGYMALLSGLKQGRRTLLLEPLRALAQEKYDELIGLLPRFADNSGHVPGVCITTGDYRLAGETMMAAPPESGEIVIATPERVEAIMRIPDYDPWIRSFGSVCVDEAHLIGDQRRGPCLEGVITRFLCGEAPPRFVLLSATLGNCDLVKDWLTPCDIAHSVVRSPLLKQQLLVLEKDEKADDAVIELLERIFIEPEVSVLIFVYRTTDAEHLSEWISRKMKPRFGKDIAAAYHSKMAAQKKNSVKADYENGELLCLVSTTALGAGVNLPATHVIIRDLTFGRDGALSIPEIIQMSGRAGRGKKAGLSSIILKPFDNWKEELAEELKSPLLPALQSSLRLDGKPRKNKSFFSRELQNNQVAKLILGQLVLRDDQEVADIKSFFNNSLGGKDVADQVEQSLQWLCNGQRLLAWEDDHCVGATALGKAVSLSSIPLDVGAGFGSIIKDIIYCDEDDKILGKWTPLDTLIVLELMDPREKGMRRFSKKLAEQVDAWIESHRVKPVLFVEWIRGTTEGSKAEEIVGSLGIQLKTNKTRSEQARQLAYSAVMRAIVIFQLGEGMLLPDVAKRWGVKGLEGVQERWRDHLLWQISGLGEILDIRCFYYFLREECDASDKRVNCVKDCFKKMRHGVYDLLGLLRFCSPLGPVFRALESAKVGVGVRTKEKLEFAGISSFADINKMPIEELISIGVRSDIATKLKAYVRRRSL